MKETSQTIQHPRLGEIVYTENIWTGKKSITANGVPAQAITKKDFLINGEKATVKGNTYSGMSLVIGDEEYVLIEKSTWYEIVLAVLPAVFLLTWGNSVTLCSIFPVIGGAIGGAFGGAMSVFSLLFMKRMKTPLTKILMGLGLFALTLLIAFLLALAFIAALS